MNLGSRSVQRTAMTLAATFAVLALGAPRAAAEPANTLPGGILAEARAGFTPEQARKLRQGYSPEALIAAGDVALFHFLDIGLWLETEIAARSGAVMPLEVRLDPAIGQTHVGTAGGGLPLLAYLRSEKSRAQGMIVMQGGRIIFEDYPGMRPTDNHVWMSISKTTASLVVRQLVEEGKIDVDKPIDSYIPALRGTEWRGTRVIDVLDMASGMDIVENQANRENPHSIIARYNHATVGEPNADGKVESQLEVIRTAKRMGPAGVAFDYSSLNTTVLALLAEAVEGRRWGDIFQDRVWAKMGVEGDMQVALAPDGTPQAHGLLATRLRDLARYGLLYTPSWAKASREQIVSDAYVHEIQTGGRQQIFRKGELGNVMAKAVFPAHPPSANHWQWDAIWDDGDFFKGGVFGQGLYVSPRNDLVVAWYSTVMSSDLPQYARQISDDLGKRKP
ncbi:class A beta-lactamase-related serine hydrolase [Polymorphobacter arshaanensis]|uniref:Class A beta-lactamase-related serine hydrolase n=2 Tax=Glacieibacterium arshaanense TaxID=2511025 RepID=A0A4Y9EPR9_9SPHN|nr:class A beta-lactamase-related serine hydrolase [Polymorphobacter arshaanensis]